MAAVEDHDQAQAESRQLVETTVDLPVAKVAGNPGVTWHETLVPLPLPLRLGRSALHPCPVSGKVHQNLVAGLRPLAQCLELASEIGERGEIPRGRLGAPGVGIGRGECPSSLSRKSRF
jgi:hypothetical protein